MVTIMETSSKEMFIPQNWITNYFKSDDVYIDDANPFKVPLASTPYDRQGKPEFERTGDGDPNISYTCGQVIINGKPWIQKPLLKEARE